MFSSATTWHELIQVIVELCSWCQMKSNEAEWPSRFVGRMDHLGGVKLRLAAYVIKRPLC
jgi:hypothetical protein